MKLPSEADRALSGIADLARRDPTVGAAFPDLLATLDRVLAKIDKTPVAVPIEDENQTVKTYRVGGYALRFIIAKFYLHDPDNSRYLPKLLDEIETGRRPWSLTFNVLQMLRSPVSLTWFTTDAASGVTALRAGRIAAEAGASRLGDSLNFPFPDINAAWEMKDLGDAFRTGVTSDVPTLFLVGSRDGITPVAQTREVMKGFSNAQLLVVENAGHTSMFRAPEVAPALAGFLGGASVPTTARIEPVPFLPLVTVKAR
jgi:pimeloyl-ACP methyl ester carboxylesterase